MDFSKWTPNIKVEIWGEPLKCEKPDNCPEPDKHRACVDDNGNCPHFMGHEVVKGRKHWGDVLEACCWRLIELNEDL